MEKLGVFLCTGCEIGEHLDVERIREAAEEEGVERFETHPCLCSAEGVSAYRAAIEEDGLDGVLVAACSPREKVQEFQVDPERVVLYRVGLREQAVWSQERPDEEGEENQHMLGEDLVRMGLARLQRSTLPSRLKEGVERKVLVVGGGVAGLNAALACSRMGYGVVLVEKTERLGGYQAGLKYVVPEEPPYGRVHENRIGELEEAVRGAPGVEVYTGAAVEQVSGQPGQFDVEVKTASGTLRIRVGAIVQATGSRPYEASRLGHLGYGKSSRVVTSVELDALLAEGKFGAPESGGIPKRVVFVQCAGSRDKEHLPYCSSECCVGTLRQVSTLHLEYPEVECAVVYRDLRAPGQLEHFYLGVQEETGCLFTRGEVERVETEGGLRVHVKESLLGEEIVLGADLVVLATGQVPTSADGESIREYLDAKQRMETGDSEKQRKDAAEVVERLKEHEGTEILHLTYRQGPDLPVLKYMYPDSHYICFPYETRRTGIYTAGTVHAPMDAAQAAEDGYGAAMKAVQCIESTARGEAVHPRSGDIGIADFFLQRCTQCKRCTEECPFGTLNEDEKGTPEYNPLRCRRCGICLGACPERIISFPDYSVDSVASMIKAFEVPDEFEEKPRMIAFVCENDALPALDEAARRRLKWNSWMRVIPVRCLGAVNVVWIADALSRGIDGILLMGCKKGEDYQCHYIRGSELAERRMENVKETLERLTLESDRVRIEEVERHDWARIPEIFESFAETIEEVGPNPYKGF